MACGRRVGAVLAAAQDGGWQHAEASTASSPDFSCISSNLRATGVQCLRNAKVFNCTCQSALAVSGDWKNRHLAALEFATAAASGRWTGCSGGRYFDSVLCKKMKLLKAGLIPVSHSFAMRFLMNRCVLQTPRRTAIMEAAAEQTHTPI